MIFAFSLDISGKNIPSPNNVDTITDAAYLYECMSAAIPEHATILLFSRPDGSMDIDRNPTEYAFAQYELVPRIIYSTRSGPVKIDDYTWLIGFNLSPEDLSASLKQSYETVQTCDQYTIMKKAP